MSMLDAALAWAARGFRVFPLAEGTKDQPLCSFSKEATNDEAWVRAWWQDPATGQSRNHNIGVLTTDMVVVDIDVRGGKPGLSNFLSMVGLFDTLTIRTPSGGLHCYYTGPDSVGLQGKHGLGDGLDIRSHANYVVAPGSFTRAGPKTAEGFYQVEIDLPMAPVPAPVAVRLRPPLTRANAASYTLDETPGLVARAIAFLASPQAPAAVQGDAGDDTTYRTACRLRDLGMSEQGAFALLLTHWNDKCLPPWDPEELQAKVENAYNYATGAVGQLSPETHFANLQIPEVPAPEPVGQGVFAFGNALDVGALAPRPWLMTPILMRRHVSVLVGAGGAGKSVMSIEIAAHLAMGQTFMGFAPRGGPTRSIVYDEEDDLEEMSRRLWAICQQFKFPYEQVRGRIVLLSRKQLPLRVTEGDPPQIHAEHCRALVEAASPHDVGLIVLGPFVAIHGTSEDDNVKMSFVMGVLREIAEAADVAILLGHHVSKPSGGNSRAGDAYSARGAGAIINSARFAFTLYTPTEGECEKLGLKVEDRHQYVRFDGAKMNLALHSGHASWLKKVSVRLPNNDDVGVLVPHDMATATAVVTLLWSTIIAAEMKGKATASCTISEAANYLRAGDPLAAKIAAGTLRARVVTALSDPVQTLDGTLKLVQIMTGGKFEKKVVLE